MIDRSELDSRINRAVEREPSLAARHADHELLLEYRHRLAEARNAIRECGESDTGNPAVWLDDEMVRSLMACCFNLNRCDAIYESLGLVGAPGPESSSGDLQSVVDLSRDRTLLRWIMSSGSLLRSRLLGYEDYYRMPPLGETLQVARARPGKRPSMGRRLARRIRRVLKRD